MFIEKGSLWAGTTSSLQQLSNLSEKFEAQMPDLLAKYSDEAPDDDYKPYEVTKQGTAIISIRGSLINRDLPTFIASWFGVTTYPSLQRQLFQAASDNSVERILLDVNSGGGSVVGLHETLEALHEAKAKKPVATYTSDCMCSAAYWLGSVGETVGVSPAATLGSIGVIAVHIESKEALERDGYKPTVMRSGAKKHLGHELETFTDEARAELQSHMDTIHQLFIEDVAKNRPVLVGNLLTMADGRVYTGKEAIQNSFADSLTTFNQFLADFEANTSQSFHQRGGFAAEHGVSTMNLEQAMARIAELESAEEAGKTALVAAETRAATAEANAASLQASNNALSASLAAAEKDREAFSAVLDKNIQVMGAALNAELLIPEDLAGKQAYFNQLQEKFNAKFPTGGVAATATPEADAKHDVPDWFNKVQKG